MPEILPHRPSSPQARPGAGVHLHFRLGGAACDAFPGSGAALYADRPLATDDPYRYFRW